MQNKYKQIFIQEKKLLKEEDKRLKALAELFKQAN